MTVAKNGTPDFWFPSFSRTITAIKLNDNVVGQLTVVLDTSKPRSALLSTAILITLIVIMVSILGITISRSLSKRVVDPIVALRNTMNDLDKNLDIKPLTVSASSREINELYSSFNHMLLELNTRMTMGFAKITQKF